MEKRKNLPTIDDFTKHPKKAGISNMADQIKQSEAVSKLTNPELFQLFPGAAPIESLPKEAIEKLTIFREPSIEECIIYNSIEEIKKRHED